MRPECPLTCYFEDGPVRRVQLEDAEGKEVVPRVRSYPIPFLALRRWQCHPGTLYLPQGPRMHLVPCLVSIWNQNQHINHNTCIKHFQSSNHTFCSQSQFMVEKFLNFWHNLSAFIRGWQLVPIGVTWPFWIMWHQLEDDSCSRRVMWHQSPLKLRSPDEDREIVLKIREFLHHKLTLRAVC